MRKLIVAVVMLAMATVSQATLLYSFDFSGTGSLTADADWTAYSGADGSITQAGGVAQIGSGAEDVGAQTAYAAQTGPVYAGLDINVLSPSSADDYTFGFLDGASGMGPRWGFDGESASTYTIDGYSGGSGVASNSTTALTTGTVYRVVIGFDGVDNHKLWINPTVGDFGSPDLEFTNANANDPDGFFFRQGGGWDNGEASWEADNLRVADTFAEAVPEPSTITLLAVAIAGLGFFRKMRK